MDAFRLVLLISFIGLMVGSCESTSDSKGDVSEGEKPLPPVPMDVLTPDQTGVDFVNQFDMSEMRSPLDYVNVFNGGGVAVADFNNDGLTDLYFTGNLSNNKMYFNKGNFEFEDVTEKAGVTAYNSWSTAATVVDINRDGWMDLYVCRSYHNDPIRRANLLYVNNGDGTFTERGQEYGIADDNYSIAAVFFDADRDGNVDLFVGNHPRNLSVPIEERYEKWLDPVEESTDNLFINNGDGTFTKRTKEAGMFNHGWTLGVVAADLNQDGWIDIYVAVDHDEPDRFYLNNGDGTFSQSVEEYFKHTSFSSMGLDAGDINNDGLLDLFVLDMLAPDQYREKTQMGSMNPEKFWSDVERGWHYQYMRNMLHVNNGEGHFSEVGQMAGIHRTDWSWSALMADWDNDGWKDIYVTNGYYRDILDKDHRDNFNNTIRDHHEDKARMTQLISNYTTSVGATRLDNYFFHNNKDLTFTDRSEELGIAINGFSSGAAYADLDNDGDLDLIINNIDEPASIVRNNEREKRGYHYLRFAFVQPKDRCIEGASITIFSKEGQQYQEYSLTRGFQSSVESFIHFGLGRESVVSKVVVRWLDNKTQVLENVKADQVIQLKYEDASHGASEERNSVKPIFSNATGTKGLEYVHDENDFDDYTYQVLLPHKMSQFGPFITKADVNGDGLEDIFVGGPHKQAGTLFIQDKAGHFSRKNQPALMEHKNYEDMGALFFDADGDGDLDLYVVSGGNEFSPGSSYYQDRLYLNDGAGEFTYAPDMLPEIAGSGSCVRAVDFDGDGDLDLFVGGRHNPRKYPSPGQTYLLENREGKFVDVTEEKAPGLSRIGMVTDAVWQDLNGDGDVDLLVVGEWMPLTFFIQENGEWKDQTKTFAPPQSEGWWNRVVPADLNGDGLVDFVVGNLGKNYKYLASPEKPFLVYGGDLDSNGTYDIVLSWIEDGTPYPVRGKQCSSEQIPEIKKKFPTYDAFGRATLEEIYGEDLENALHYKVHTFANSILWNRGNGRFELTELPSNAQVSLGNGIIVDDFDKDGKLDIILAGNLYTSEVETGRADAGLGVFLKGKGDGKFTSYTAHRTGLLLEGDVKDLQTINLADGTTILIAAKNNAPLQVVTLQGGELM